MSHAIISDKHFADPLKIETALPETGNQDRPAGNRSEYEFKFQAFVVISISGKA